MHISNWKNKNYFWEVKNALFIEHAASINPLLGFHFFFVHFTRSSGHPVYENIFLLFFPNASFYFSCKNSGLSWHTLDINLKHLLTVSSSWTGLFFWKSKTRSQFKDRKLWPGFHAKHRAFPGVRRGSEKVQLLTARLKNGKERERRGLPPPNTHVHLSPPCVPLAPRPCRPYPKHIGNDPARSAQHALAGGKGREGKGKGDAFARSDHHHKELKREWNG